MGDWVYILIASVIFSLVGVIFGSMQRRITRLEMWRDEMKPMSEVLLKSEHYELCKQNTRELMDFIDKRISELKSEIRKLNGGR